MSMSMMCNEPATRYATFSQVGRPAWACSFEFKSLRLNRVLLVQIAVNHIEPSYLLNLGYWFSSELSWEKSCVCHILFVLHISHWQTSHFFRFDPNACNVFLGASQALSIFPCSHLLLIEAENICIFVLFEKELKHRMFNLARCCACALLPRKTAGHH